MFKQNVEWKDEAGILRETPAAPNDALGIGFLDFFLVQDIVHEVRIAITFHNQVIPHQTLSCMTIQEKYPLFCEDENIVLLFPHSFSVHLSIPETTYPR